MRSASFSVTNDTSVLKRSIRWILIRLIFLEFVSQLSRVIQGVHTSPPGLLDFLSKFDDEPVSESQQQQPVNRAATFVSHPQTPHWLQQSRPQHLNFQPPSDARVRETEWGAQATSSQDQMQRKSKENNIRSIPVIMTSASMKPPRTSHRDGPTPLRKRPTYRETIRSGPSRNTLAWRLYPNGEGEKKATEELLRSVSIHSMPGFQYRTLLQNEALFLVFRDSFRYPMPKDEVLWSLAKNSLGRVNWKPKDEVLYSLAGNSLCQVISHQRYRTFKKQWMRALLHNQVSSRSDTINDATQELGSGETRTLCLERDHQKLLDEVQEKWFTPSDDSEPAVLQGHQPEPIWRSVDHATKAGLYFIKLISGIYEIPLYKTEEELANAQRNAFRLWASFFKNLDFGEHDTTEMVSSGEELVRTELQDDPRMSDFSDGEVSPRGARPEAGEDSLAPAINAGSNQEEQRAVSIIRGFGSRSNRAERNTLSWVLIAYWLRNEHFVFYLDLQHARESIVKDFKSMIHDKVLHIAATQGSIQPRWNIVSFTDFRIRRPVGS